MLERFDNINLLALLASIQAIRLSFEGTRRQLGGGKFLEGTNKETALSLFRRAEKIFPSMGFGKSFERARFALQQIERVGALDYSMACTELHGLELCILGEISSFFFVQIRADRKDFFPVHEHPVSRKKVFWFGANVDSEFPSARDDISEAGYCLAVEANTAAAYHFVCAAEHGLRALAKDRRVKCPKGAIEALQWGDIIRELEDSVKKIQSWPNKKSGEVKAKEAAFEFYSKAVKECQYFNHAHRRHLAHARKHYDRHEALSVMTHARDFFRLLASKISETKKTPLVWKRA